MSKDGEHLAFPHEFKFGNGTADRASGMTLRDYFAAKAMQAYCSDSSWLIDMDNTQTASSAYRMADAMLKERAK